MFTLLLSITFASASFFLFRHYARESVLRLAEFNLRLVANLIEQDLVELNGLANRQSLDQETVRYLQSDRPTAWQALSLYSNMADSANECRAYSYLQRFIVTDVHCERIVHASNLTNSVPLRTYNIRQLPEIERHGSSVWQLAFHDPLLPNTVPDSILAAYPVYVPRSQQLGTVYLTASARLFSDRLSGYISEDAGTVYLRTAEGLWQLERDLFRPASLEIVSSKRDSVPTQSPATVIPNIQTSDRKAYALNKEKIAAAKTMLACGELKIYEIAEHLGYESAFYFSKAFKKRGRVKRTVRLENEMPEGPAQRGRAVQRVWPQGRKPPHSFVECKA